MQFSGYDETFRAQVIRVRSALNAYRQMVTKDQQGEEPLYRPRAKERRTKIVFHDMPLAQSGGRQSAGIPYFPPYVGPDS